MFSIFYSSLYFIYFNIFYLKIRLTQYEVRIFKEFYCIVDNDRKKSSFSNLFTSVLARYY